MTMTVDQHRKHQFRNLMIHPKKCPKCNRVWEGESAMRCKCIYCKHRLIFETNKHEGETQIWKMLIPILVWLLLGLAILTLIGRHYNG